MKLVRLTALIGMTLSSACTSVPINREPLTFSVDGHRIAAEGVIDGNSLAVFEDVLKQHPESRTLVLKKVDGSVDDEANYEFGRMLRKLQFTTVVPAGGLVASGGTDLFLSGMKRILEPGACVGVHPWATDDFTAVDLSPKSAEHRLYLRYYEDTGIDPAFYWFTLRVGTVESVHWMSAKEVEQFGVSTESVPDLGTAAICDGR